MHISYRKHVIVAAGRDFALCSRDAGHSASADQLTISMGDSQSRSYLRIEGMLYLMACANSRGVSQKALKA